jgi:uncharacterized protein YdeI (YjbR/CyaY-like superfamily)
MTMITMPEDFFTKGCGRCARFATPQCSTRQWAIGLGELRRICLASGLVETVKWGHPCYTLGERNVAIIGAFREDFCLTFFNAALLKDADGLLEKAGPNTRHASLFRFSDNDQVKHMEATLSAYLAEAKAHAAAGTKAPKEAVDLELPDELSDALDGDSELAEAFHRLTPGRQRSYVINLNSAKTSSTRLARIAKFRDKIIAGKGALER